MDKEILEQLSIIIQGMSDLRQEVKDAEARTRVFIENQVVKRVDSLFDGYKLVHEKQWELERQTEALKMMIDELSARLAALENKIA